MAEANTKETENDTVLKVSDSDSEKHLLNIVGNSYARGCASKIQDILNKNFNVIGLTKFGTNTLKLADSAKKQSEI
jgi:hypothetical protein